MNIKNEKVTNDYLLIGVGSARENANKYDAGNNKLIHYNGIDLAGYTVSFSQTGFAFGCKGFKWDDLEKVDAFLNGKGEPVKVKVLRRKANGEVHSAYEVVGEVEGWVLYREFGLTTTPSIVSGNDYEGFETEMVTSHGLQKSGENIRMQDGTNIGSEKKVKEVVEALKAARDFIVSKN